MSHDQILEIINAQVPFGVRLNKFDVSIMFIGSIYFFRYKDIFGRHYWRLADIDVNIKRKSDVHNRLEELYFGCFVNNSVNHNS